MYRIYEQEKKLFQIVYFKDPSSRLEIKKNIVKQIKTKNSHSMNLYPKAPKDEYRHTNTVFKFAYKRNKS